MIKTVLFDVNETLLDMSSLRHKFSNYFDDDSVMNYWFSKLLHTSMVVSSIGEYTGFANLAETVLEIVFKEKNMEITDEIKTDILSTFSKLNPHGDVYEAIKILKDNEIRIIPMSNSSKALMQSQLSHAKLLNKIDNYYSVDSVKKFKPFQDIYKYVINNEDIDPEETVMIACHDWDLYGAKKLSLVTGYIKRKNTIYNPYYSLADMQSDNLVTLVKQIINY